MTELYGIYLCRKTWKDCDDARPWIVVNIIDQNTCLCFPISGQAYGDPCFELPPDRPEFPATGLTKTSYIHDTHAFEVDAEEMLRQHGRLTGELLQEFIDYAGLG